MSIPKRIMYPLICTMVYLGFNSCGEIREIRCSGTYVSSRFLVGYYLKDQKPKDYNRKFRQLVKKFKICGFQYRLYEYGSDSLNVAFKTDTFYFGHMEQFEPRSGFWLYDVGEEAHDFGMEEVDSVIQQGYKYFE